jgi:hypothetical protein
VSPRNLDSILDGLGAGRKKHCFVGASLAHQFIQPLSECDVGFVGGNLESHMSYVLQLVLYGRYHTWMVVADVKNADPAYKIQIAAPCRVPDVGSFRTIHDDGMSGQDAPRHVLIADRHPITCATDFR